MRNWPPRAEEASLGRSRRSVLPRCGCAASRLPSITRLAVARAGARDVRSRAIRERVPLLERLFLGRDCGTERSINRVGLRRLALAKEVLDLPEECEAVAMVDDVGGVLLGHRLRWIERRKLVGLRRAQDDDPGDDIGVFSRR